MQGTEDNLLDICMSMQSGFTREIAKELVSLYNRLLDKTLLGSCCRMKTQNANESFNALIWRRCPKTEFA